jgi:uncharacterized membrane protein
MGVGQMAFLQIAVQWLHVLGGIFWFGGVLFASVVLGPTMMSLPPRTGAAVFDGVAKRAWIGEAVGGATIMLGVVRGTVLGPVKSIEFLFGTAYGITWLVALLLGLGILAWSHFVVFTGTDRMTAAIAAGDAAAMRRGLAPAMLNVIGFFGIFTCMILMRFGL